MFYHISQVFNCFGFQHEKHIFSHFYAHNSFYEVTFYNLNLLRLFFRFCYEGYAHKTEERTLDYIGMWQQLKKLNIRFSGTLICAAVVIGHETVRTLVVENQTFSPFYNMNENWIKSTINTFWFLLTLEFTQLHECNIWCTFKIHIY